MIEDVVGIGLDQVYGRAKSRRRIAKQMIAGDGELEAIRRKRRMLEEDREAAITDPDSPHYRPPQQGERPSPRAQWDDAQACWVEWDRSTSEWVRIDVPEADTAG